MLDIVGSYIPDERIRALVANIVGSFSSGIAGKGLPLGNLTSQLFVNIYLNELDQFVDFLGWVHFPDHRVLRTATKKRMFRRIDEMNGKEETVQSYLGMLGWGE